MHFNKKLGSYRIDNRDASGVLKQCSPLPKTPCPLGCAETQEPAKLGGIITELATLEEILRADGQHSMLIILQGVDGSGKDSVAKHVLEKFRTRIVDHKIAEFKAAEPQTHYGNFLEKFESELPRPGEIVVLNRSYYEEVLTARVHPELLGPSITADEAFWSQRMARIRDFEAYWSKKNIIFVKIFLHISKEEQRLRLLRRLETPQKIWKFSPDDFAERFYWNQYQDAYDEMLRHTSPWHIIPGDRKSFEHVAVATIVLHYLRALKLHFPKPERNQEKTLAELRKALQK